MATMVRASGHRTASIAFSSARQGAVNITENARTDPVMPNV
jgi:hypothetical protein